MSARSARPGGVLLTAVAVAVVLLSAACSSGGGSHSSTSTTVASTPTSSAGAGSATAGTTDQLPECSTLLGKPASVWLPVAKGDGCMQGSEIEPAYTVHCKDGSDLLDFGRAPTYFGLSSGTLAASQQAVSQSSGAYGQLYQHCAG